MQTTHILFTGGTIAMRTNAEGLLVPAQSGEQLLSAIPALSGVHITTQQLSNLASAHLRDVHWLATFRAIQLACADPAVCGVVLVQGTDTLEETAFFLDVALSPADTHNKPVVLTGAMLSADCPDSDGPSNLLNAIRISQSGLFPSHFPNVVVTMHSVIHSARAVQKFHSTHPDAFRSVHHPELATIDALGHIDMFTDFVSNTLNAQISSHIDNDTSTSTATTSHIQLTHPSIHDGVSRLPRVDIISTHVDADSTQIHACVAAGAQALIVIALGAGNTNPSVFSGIQSCLDADIPVIIATRCWEGCSEPHYGYVGGGQTLAHLGCAFAHDLPPIKRAF